jgi:hypothetical protein
LQVDDSGVWNGYFSFMCRHLSLSAWTTASSIVRVRNRLFAAISLTRLGLGGKVQRTCFCSGGKVPRTCFCLGGKVQRTWHHSQPKWRIHNPSEPFVVHVQR